jgi:uncharacterized membrane protein
MQTDEEKASIPKRLRCAISGEQLPEDSLIALSSLRPSLAELIIQQHPTLKPHDVINRTTVNQSRSKLVEQMLLAEHGELTELDRDVALSLARQDTIAENIEKSYEGVRSFGDRLADGFARFGGSWVFLISFAVILAMWMGINSAASGRFDFDPYPFIFLNLILSCLAAVQAPIILMSQRRAEMKDRLRAESDYRVNLKAELEIRHLHEKVDHLVSKQWQRLLEIQQLQLEAMSSQTGNSQST